MSSGLATIPPAQVPNNHQALVKLALRPRQKRIFLLALLFLHFLLSATTLSLKALVNPISLLASVAAFVTGVVPLLVARKRILSSTTHLPNLVPVPRVEQAYLLLSDPAAWVQAGLHSAAFGALATTSCLLIATLHGADSEWAPHTWNASHHAYYANERFLYFIGQALMLGAVYAHFLRAWPSRLAKTVLPFPIGPRASLSSTLRKRVLAALAQRLPAAALGGGVAGLGLFVGYVTIRHTFWSAILTLVGHRSLARRALIPSFRTNFPQTDVAFRSILFGSSATAAVETAYILLDTYLSQPIAPVSRFTKDPNRVLSEGLSERIVFFSHHAFSELAIVAAGDSARRVAIFKDVATDRSAWTSLSAACLDIINAERIHIASRAVRLAQASPDSTSSVTKGTDAAKSPADSNPTVWDALARGTVAVDTASVGPGQGQDHRLTLSKSTAGATRRSASSLVSSLIATAWNCLPADARHALCPPRWRFFLFGPSISAKASSLAGRDSARLAWSVSALHDLLQHSLDEDPFGSAQKDIKAILEAFVGLFSELRALRIELEAEAATLDHELSREEAAARAPICSAQPDSRGQESGQVKRSSTTTHGSALPLDTQQHQARNELAKVWTTCGASTNEALLRTAIKDILETFARFGLQLEPKLEALLSTALEECDTSTAAQW